MKGLIRISIFFEQIYPLIKRGYVHNEVHGLEYMTVAGWEQFPGIAHAFSTRIGGVSAPPYGALNFSMKRPGNDDSVFENYRRMAQAVDINVDDMVLINYDHSDLVEIVGAHHKGMGFFRENQLPVCDSLITNEPEVVLVTIHADCTSFLIYDPVKNVVAASHAGWKGTLNRIGQKTIEKMQEGFGCDPGDIYVGIGPSICKDCFEVDWPVAQFFEPAFPDADIVRLREDGKYMIDLAKCAAKQFLDAGINPQNIVISDECTYTDKERYFSYRRDNIHCGSMAGFISIREKAIY